MKFKILIVLLVIIFFIIVIAINPLSNTKKNNSYLRTSGITEIKGLNPFNPSFNDVYSASIQRNIWEPLYKYSPDFSENHEIKNSPDKRIIPWIAKEMPIYNEVDNKHEVIVKIRQDVYWWDKKKLTADDVVFSGNLMLNFGIPVNDRSSWQIIEGKYYVDKIEKIDNFTIKYTLNELVPIFQIGPLMSMIFPKHQWKPIVDKSIKKFNEHEETDINKRNLIANEIWSVDVGKDLKLNEIIGSGPFKPVNWKQGEYMRMDSNHDYWAKGRIIKIYGKEYEIGPYIDGILRMVYKSSDTINLVMKNGDIDITSIQPSDISYFQKNNNMEIKTCTRNSLFFIGFNLRKKPMSYLCFRQSVSYLYNKELLNDRVFHGRLSPIYSVVPYVNEYWHNPNLQTYGKGMNTIERQYKAFNILKECGFDWKTEPRFEIENEKPIKLISKGIDIIMPDGNSCPELKIFGSPASEVPDSAQANIMLQEWMNDIGIPAKFIPIDFGTATDFIYPSDLSEPNFDINTVVGWSLGPDPMYLKDLWHSSHRPEMISGGLNAEGYINFEYDKLSEQSIREMDPKKRRKIVFKLQEIISKEIPIFPTTTVTNIQVYRKDRFEDWFSMPTYGIGGAENQYSYMILKPKQ